MATWSRCNERSRKISRHRNTRFSDLGKNFIRGMQRKEHVDSAKPYRSFQNKKNHSGGAHIFFLFSNNSGSTSFFQIYPIATVFLSHSHFILTNTVKFYMKYPVNSNFFLHISTSPDILVKEQSMEFSCFVFCTSTRTFIAVETVNYSSFYIIHITC